MDDRIKQSFNRLRIKNISYPGSHIKTAQWVHYLLSVLLILLVAFTIVNILSPNLFWPPFEIVDYQLHSTMEALGAIAAILVAFMPLQVLFGKYKPSYVFLSVGFLVMGLWEMFHSFYKIGHGFVFTDAVALLSGGFFFALFVFPWKINADKAKPYLLIIVGFITILLATFSALNRELFPEMMRDGLFTPTAENIHLAAGALFLVSAVKLIAIYIKGKNLGVLILVYVAVFSAIVGLTFHYSIAWNDSWWLWHMVRLIAFLAVLGYMFWRIQTISSERNAVIESLKDKQIQLLESEERFRLVNEATSHGLWDWDVVNNTVYFSPVWKMQVGYRDEEIENDFNNWVNLLHSDDKERCMKALESYMQNPNGKFILEFRFHHKDGHYVWIHNEAASVIDKDGKVVRMFGAHTDITKQKEAEEKRAESEKLFRIIFENSPLGKSRTGLDGSLNINKAFSDITGYNEAELQQKNWKEITHPDDIKESEEIIQSLISGERNSARFEKRYLHKAGHFVWTEVNTSLHRDENGTPQFFITTISDISKRKETEERIKQSEKKFKGLFENDPSAIMIADPETGLLQDVNPAAEKLMEMSRKELIGLHQSKLHPEDIKQEQQEMFKQLQGKTDISIDSVVAAKSGRRKPVEIKASMVEIDNKAYILGIFHDISKLTEQQQKLKESELKYRTLTESSQDQIFTINKDFKVLYVNDKAAKSFRTSPDKIIGRHLKDIFPPEVAERQIQSISSVLKTGKTFTNTTKSVFPGKTLWLDTTLVPLHSENGQADAVMGVSRDVSAQKIAEETLKQSEEKHRSIFESATDAFIIASLEGKIVEVNPSASRIYGYDYDEMIGKNATELIHPDYHSRFSEFIKEVQEKGYCEGETVDIRKDQSTFITEVHGSVINFNNQKHMLAVIRDVSEKQKAEQEIRKSEEKFRNLFNSVSIPLVHVKENGEMESINRRFKENLGYTLDDIPTIDHWWEKAYPDKSYRKWVIKNWEDAVQQSIDNKTDIKSDVYNVSCKNGEVRQMVISGITFGKDVLATFIDVTEQRKAEEAIIQEKEFTESVINALPGIFYLFNDQGKYLKWNKMLEELSGFSAKEIAEGSPLDYFADYHREKVAAAIETAFKEGDTSVEADLLVKGEIPTPFYFTGRSIEFNGKPHLLGVGLDISQRKRAEKEKEKVLHALNERIKEMTCLFEVNEAIKNPAVDIPSVMERITRSIPRGWQYPENTSVEILLDGKVYHSKNFKDGNIYLQEKIMMKDAERGYVKVVVSGLNSQQSKTPFVEEEKELLKTIAGNISIYVQRVESDQEIKEREENFRNVYSNSPVSIWQEDWTEIIQMIDELKKEGVKDFKKYFNESRQFVNNALTKVIINDVNQATLEMFEARNKEDLLKSLEVVFATEDTLPGFIGELIALAEGKQLYESEMKLNTAKGNLIHVMLRMSFPSEGIQDGQVLVSIMDITELKKVQNQLKDSMEKLQRSNKELERFAYVASHDLQEPLRMVSSYTQLLERRYKDQLDERADKYIHYAVDGATRMQNLINDLLDFSRISTRGEKFTRTDTNEVVSNTLNNLEARINETGARIKTAKLPVIKADSGQIERLFLNLIGNAIKFSKPDEKPVIEIDVKDQKDKWLFSIKDNGIGIDEKYKEKVFVIFQRLHGATQYKGTGIGLAVCKRIIQRHEGEIWFESEENKGTTFYFTLKKHNLKTIDDKH